MQTKILILDDDPLLTLMYRGIFETTPNSLVDFVNTPAQFWSLIGKNNFDLVFLDIELGDSHEDGLSILAKLGKLRPTIPVIMMSSRDDCETVGRCLELGARTFQPKSSGFIFKLRELVENLSQHHNHLPKSA